MIDDKSSFFFTALHSFAASIFCKPSLSKEAPSQPRKLQGDRRVERMGSTPIAGVDPLQDFLFGGLQRHVKDPCRTRLLPLLQQPSFFFRAFFAPIRSRF